MRGFWRWLPVGILASVGLYAGAVSAAPVLNGTASSCDELPSVSAAILYNRGNAHARAAEVGLAVLCYERARVMLPGDPDLRMNLERVRATAGLPPQSANWLERHARVVNPNILYGMGLCGLVLGGAGALFFRFHGRRRRRLGLMTMSVGVPLLLMAAVDAAATWPVMHAAVVLHATVARVSPVSGGDPVFSIAEGQVVQATDAYQGFRLVHTDSSRAGWVAQDDLQPII